MKIYLASDHAGFTAKEEIKTILSKKNITFEDLGPNNEKSVDYPDFAQKVAEKIQEYEESEEIFGILICGSGTGMQIAANKFLGIRAAFCYDTYSSEMARRDNDANILTLRAREFDHSKYEKIIKTFLNTKFSGEERHIKRIEKIFDIEESLEE